MPDALLIFLRSALAVACSANKVSKAVYFVFISVKAAVSESAVIFVAFSGFLSLQGNLRQFYLLPKHYFETKVKVVLFQNGVLRLPEELDGQKTRVLSLGFQQKCGLVGVVDYLFLKLWKSLKNKEIDYVYLGIYLIICIRHIKQLDNEEKLLSKHHK